MPTHEEVERAIRSVPGVAEATITRSEDTGRGRLRIRLHPGEDAERISWSVAATLRERFGIALDPEEIRPRLAQSPSGSPGGSAGAGTPGVPLMEQEPADPHSIGTEGARDDAAIGDIAFEEVSAPEAASDPKVANGPEAANGPKVAGDPEVASDAPLLVEASSGSSKRAAGATSLGAADRTADVERAEWRPTIRDLSSRNDGTAVSVTARLALEGRLVAGEAAGAPTARGLRRAIACATVRAIGELTSSPLRAQVDRVSVGGGDPAAVSVVVSLLSGRGEELLLGAAIVRDDVEHAVMRATLDALNRRVGQELVGSGAAT